MQNSDHYTVINFPTGLIKSYLSLFLHSFGMLDIVIVLRKVVIFTLYSGIWIRIISVTEYLPVVLVLMDSYYVNKPWSILCVPLISGIICRDSLLPLWVSHIMHTLTLPTKGLEGNWWRVVLTGWGSSSCFWAASVTQELEGWRSDREEVQDFDLAELEVQTDHHRHPSLWQMVFPFSVIESRRNSEFIYRNI